MLGVIAVFAQVRNHEIISYDDPYYVFSNPHIIQGLTLENIVYSFSHAHTGGHYHPITSISHMLDVEFFGLNPGPHHLVSAFFHAINASLLFCALLMMTGRFWPSAAIAMIFAFHPLRVESVAWASERKDVLSTMFEIITLIMYVYYVRKQSIGKYCLVLFAYILAGLSKPMVVTLPFLLLLLDYWPLNRYTPAVSLRKFGRLVVEKIPLFAVALAVALANVLVHSGLGAIRPSDESSVTERIGSMFYAYAYYLAKLFIPTNLSFFHSGPINGLPKAQVVFAIFLIIALSALAVWQWKRRPHFFVGWFWFIGTCLPIMGIIMVGPNIADRYTYFTLIGIVIAIVFEIADYIRTRNFKIAASTAFAVIIFSLVVAQYKQIQYWKNSETLYRHAAQCSNDNWIAYEYLGMELLNKNKFQESVDALNESLKICPDNIRVKRWLGQALLKLDRIDEAVAVFESFLPVIPSNVQNVDFSNDFAITRLGEIVTIYIESHLACGDAFFKKGDYDKAIYHYKEVGRVNPGLPYVYKAIALCFCQKQAVLESAPYWAGLIKIAPEQTAEFNQVCNDLLQQQNYALAEALLAKVIEFVPDNPELYSTLGITLGIEQKFDQAAQQFEKGLKIAPNSSSLEGNLGHALSSQGRYAEAVPHFQRAIILDPNNETARRHLKSAQDSLNAQPTTRN